MNNNSPTNSTLALCVVGALSSLASNQANAFQLGRLQEASRIGAPLDAYINVLMSPAEALQTTQVAVVPDFAYRNDAAMNAALDNIRAEMVHTDYGQHYIKLSSDTELNLPLLAFRIKASNGDSMLIRRFTVSPRPALPAVVQAPRGAGRSRDSFRRAQGLFQEPAPQAATPLSQQSIAATSMSEYGPVKAGDTLWKIATQVAGKNAGAILNEIFTLNPHAFIDGDINKLRQGVTLQLPGGDTPSVATANAELVVETNVTADETSSPRSQTNAEETIKANEFANETEAASSVDFEFQDETSAIPQPEIAAAEVFDATAAPVTSLAQSAEASVDWQSQNPELAERLQSLGEKYAALRARYATQQAEQAPAEDEMSQQTATTGTAAVVDYVEQGSSAETSEIAADEASNLVAQDSSGAIEVPVEAPVLTSASADSRFPLPFWMLGLIGLGVLVSGAALYLYRVRRTTKNQLKEQLAREEKDNTLKEELAKKAQHRVKMEGEVERMLHDRSPEADDAAEEESMQTMQLQVEDVMPVEAEEVELDVEHDDSPEHQINDSIAHGRYGEAEELLREVINDSPRNYSAKLRLAEVYYITERIGEFVNVSQDIHANHRAEISDEDWRRVMRMGKMIAPEQPPFSGPQSITEQASAG